MSGRDIIVECAGKEACINVRSSMKSGRQIILEGMDSYSRRIVLEKLQMLTNDKLTMRPIENGITVAIEEFSEANTLKLGTELIRNLARPGHNLKTVRIKVVGEKSYAYPAGYDWAKAENWPGTDAFIDINVTRELVVPTKDSEGKYQKYPMPLYITLAHELIHAYHIVNGESEPGGLIKHIYYYPDETGKIEEKTEDVSKEDLYTMGVSGYERERITENKIRKERGENIRIAYYSN